MDERHSRTAALLGEEAMERLARAHVLIVGVGGVGGWCAEALARSGVGNLTIVDDDTVAESNLNRQCAATVATLGRIKVEAMAERLAAVNPDCRVTALCVRYPNFLKPSNEETVKVEGQEEVKVKGQGQQRNFYTSTVHLSPSPSPLTPSTLNPQLSTLSTFDAVADAIDSVDCKAELILNATEAGVPLVSSMGAALRLDPTRVRVSRFDKVSGDGLARALRQRFKRLNRYPKNFTAIWSDEEAKVKGEGEEEVKVKGQGQQRKNYNSTVHLLSPPTFSKQCPNQRGSVMPVVATFGMCMAMEIINHVRRM